MIEIGFSSKFIKRHKKYTKKHPDQKELIAAALELFQRDPTNPKLDNHRLSGRLEGLNAIWVAFDLRIVLKYLTPEKVVLIDIGTHDEVY